MKSPLRRLSQETAIYGASTVVGRFLNFLLVPFYVNVLATRMEFGIASSLYAYLAFLSVVFPLGLEGAYFRYAARAEGERADPAREQRVFSTPFWTILIFGGALAAAIFAAAPSLAIPAFGDPSHDLTRELPMLVEILRLGAAILLLDALSVVPFASLRLEHRAISFAAIRLGNIVLTLALNFLFVLRWHWGVPGIFRANAIASAATLAGALAVNPSRLRLLLSRDVLARMLPFGLGNVPAYLAAMVVQVIDRPIVQFRLGLDELAVYQANYRMGFAMMVLVAVFDYAWRPFFLRQHATRGDAAKPLFARVFLYTTLALMLSFLGLSFFLPWFVGVRLPLVHRSLLRPSYLAGTGIIPVILLAYVFQGFYTNFIVGIYVREKSRWLPVATGLGAAANVGAIFLWIGRWGITGAAYATLVAYMVMAAALYVIAQRLYRIPYPWRRVAIIFAVVLGAFEAGQAIPGGAVKVLLFGASAALLLAVVRREGALALPAGGAPAAVLSPDPLEAAEEKLP